MPPLQSSRCSVSLPSLPKYAGGNSAATIAYPSPGGLHDRASDGIKRRSCLPGLEQRKSLLGARGGTADRPNRGEWKCSDRRRRSTAGFPDHLGRTEEQLFPKKRRNSCAAAFDDHGEEGQRQTCGHSCGLPDCHQRRRRSSVHNESSIHISSFKGCHDIEHFMRKRNLVTSKQRKEQAPIGGLQPLPALSRPASCRNGDQSCDADRDTLGSTDSASSTASLDSSRDASISELASTPQPGTRFRCRRLSEGFCQPTSEDLFETQPREARSKSKDEADLSKKHLTVIPSVGTFDSEFLPTVDDAVARYSDASFTDTERQRIRLAFIRFALAETSEVQVADLQDILIHLGYMTATDRGPPEIESLAAEVTTYSTLDFHEVHDFAEHFSRIEIAAISHAASELRASDTRQLDKLLMFFQSLGVITSEDVVTEALDMANVQLKDLEKDDRCFDEEGLLRVIAAYRSMEGFTATERAKAKQVFDERERLPSTRRSAMTGCPVKATELTKGLVKFLGPYYAPYIEQIEGKIPDSEDAPGLSFYEFLVWARRLRDIGMRAVFATFEQVSADGDGRMSVEKMLRTAAFQGFTLLDTAAGDVLQQTGLHRTTQEGIDFSTFLRFLNACHRTHGFTDGERQRFLDLYERFDLDGNDELESTEVVNMLRFQGHTTQLIDAHKIIRRVDFNQNGTMDREEFLRLMRLQREQVLVAARRAYDTVRKSAAELPTRKMAETLTRMGIDLRSEVLEGLERANEHCGATLPFETFVRIVDSAQEIAAADGRKRAGFSIPTFEALRREFDSFDHAKAGFIGTRDLIWIMFQAKMSLSTLAEREALISTTDSARKAALAAGCSEVEVSAPGYGSHHRITFWLFIHLVRTFVQVHEEKVSNREKEACEKTGFSQAEVAQFRQVFSLAVDECSEDGRFGRVVEDLFAEPALPRRSIASVLSSIGLRVSLQQHEELDEQLEELIESETDRVNFATFLRLMCWMLQTDYANITTVARTSAERRRRSVKDTLAGG